MIMSHFKIFTGGIKKWHKVNYKNYLKKRLIDKICPNFYNKLCKFYCTLQTFFLLNLLKIFLLILE